LVYFKKKRVECDCNSSEGCDFKKNKNISSSEKTVEKVKLLDINPRKTKNKTVITFIEELAQVVEAKFRLIKKREINYTLFLC